VTDGRADAASGGPAPAGAAAGNPDDPTPPSRAGMAPYFGFDLPLAERLGRIAAAGFRHTFLWWGPPDDLFVAGRGHEAPAIARDAGLTVDNAHVPFQEANELWTAGPAGLRRFRDRHLAWLDELAEHGIGCMLMHVTHALQWPGPSPAALDAMRSVADAAADRGIDLAFENTRLREPLDWLLTELDAPHVGLCYDSSHDWHWSAAPGGLLRTWGRRLLYTHLSDVCCHEDRHMLPGEGDIDWPALAADFPRRTYAGPLTLEVIPADTARFAGPDDLLQQARQAYDRLARLFRPADDQR